MSTRIYTGHEAEMEYEAEAKAAWAAKPKAERQLDVMRSRVESALEMLKSVGKENLFGEIVTAEDAAESVMYNLRQALMNAENQK